MTEPPSNVTDVTDVPQSLPDISVGVTGNTVTSVTIPTDTLPLSFADLEEHLAPSWWEAAWVNQPESDLIAARHEWIQSGINLKSFGKRWRQLNRVTATAYARLTGCSQSALKKQMRVDGSLTVLDPETGKPHVSLRKAFACGYKLADLKRAIAGEDVFLSREAGRRLAEEVVRRNVFKRLEELR